MRLNFVITGCDSEKTMAKNSKTAQKENGEKKKTLFHARSVTYPNF